MQAGGLGEVDGRPVVQVQFRFKKFKPLPDLSRIDLSYALDLNRGHLPIRETMIWDGKPKSQTFITAVRECGDQRWFPERRVCVTTPDRPGNLFDVTEDKLLELDTDPRIDDREFALTLPAGTSISEGGSNDALKSFKLRQQERVGLDDIPTLFEMLEKKKSTPLMDTAIPRRKPYWRWVGVAGVLLAVVGAAALLRRRWRRLRTA